MSSRRSAQALSGVACLALVVAGCGGNPREAGQAGTGGGEEKVRIGLASATYGPYLPVYAAQKQDCFKQKELNAEITAYQGGGAATEAMVAGEADIISFTPAGVALARGRGVDAKIVAAGMPTSTGWSVQVPVDSKVKTVADLAGKKVGIGNPGGTGEYFALHVEKEAGIDFQTVPLGYGALNESLTRGTVDAILQLPPQSYQLPIQGKARVLVDLGQEMKPTIPDAWVASEKTINSKPDMVKKTLECIYSGVKALQNDRAFALSFLKEHAKLEGPVAEKEYESTIKALSPDGDIKPEWMDNAVELARTSGLEKNGKLPPPADLYVDKFLPVDASGGK